MNRLLLHGISNIRTIRSCILFRSDYVHSKNFEDKLLIPSKIERDIYKHILSKIWNVKNKKTKQKIFKIFRKVYSQTTLYTPTIDYLLRSKIENKTERISENIKRISNISSQTFSSGADNIKDSHCRTTSKIDNATRPVRGEPGEVIWGFIPKEWSLFFVPITGHSGFYTLLVTLGTYLFSKEIYVCDHDYYNGISVAMLCIYVVKKHGPALAKYLDKEIDIYERNLNNWKEQKKQNLKDALLSEEKSQECMEGQKILIDAKRENVHLQREAEFRKRQMDVYETVTRILNYHVELEHVRKSFQHKNLIQWVTKEVEKSLTPEMKEKYMKLCMADIKEIFKGTEK